MANYSLVIDSKFRPFEYQELLAPVLLATQAHQQLEDAYGDLDTEAAVWDRRTEGSERAHSLYTNFSRDLANAAETLSKYGLTPQSRRTMLNMKSRYAKDITPIVEAWTKRQADIKAQQEAMLRDPYHAFNRVAADTSLDTYLDNPNIDVLSENASGAVLAAQVRAMAGDVKNYIDNRNIGQLEKLGLPYQYIQKIIHGATADQVLKTMQGDPEAAPFLYNIVDTVMKGSGVRDWSSMNGDWANNPIYKQLESQAMTGLTAAIGTTELKNYTDNFSMQSALEATRHANAMAEAREKNNPGVGSDIRHWAMGTEASSKYLGVAKDLFKKMMNSQGKMMLRYAGRTYNNPLKIYEEYKKLGAEGVGTRTFINPRTGESYEARSKGDYKAAKDAIKKKYGVTAILSDTEYQALKSLGYDNKSSLNDFNRGFRTRVNRAGSGYAASSVNMANYSHAQDVIYPTMRRFYKDSDPGFLYKYTSKGRGEAVSFNDIVSFDDKGKPNFNIDDISYSVKSPDDLIFTIGGEDYYMSPEGYGRDLANIVQGYKSRYWDYLKTDEDKSSYQDMVTMAIRNELDRFNKVRGNTDSQR